MMESNNIQTEEALDAFIQCDDYIKSDLSYDFWTPQFKQMVIENREKFQEMRDLKFDDYTPSIYEVKQEASNQDSNSRTNDKRFTAKLIEFENEFIEVMSALWITVKKMRRWSAMSTVSSSSVDSASIEKNPSMYCNAKIHMI